MTRTLKRHGNSLGLTFEKAILELLGIDEHTVLEIRTDGRTLTISPVEEGNHKERVLAAAKRTTKNHSKTLRKLAE